MPWRRSLPFLYAAAIVWLNTYIVRHAFALTFTGKMNAMHGYWLALSHLSAADWWTNAWLPQWAGGLPASLAYAPLVPWLSGKIGLFPLMAGIYILGPLALYLLAAQLTQKPAWAFAAALIYSLCAPTELFLPDGLFAYTHALDPRRLYVTFIWDEAPHQLALALVCLAAAAWQRSWPVAATLAIALAALANPFGVTGAFILGLCTVIAYNPGKLKIILSTGLAAYLLVCPFYPPSLLKILQTNAVLSPESITSPKSWLGLLALAAGLAAIAALRKVDPAQRFALALACITFALPVLFYRYDIVLLAQPGRYKTELELALPLLAVVVADRWTPRRAVPFLAVALLAAAYPQLVKHRQFSKAAIQQADPTQTIEYQAGAWLEQNLPNHTIYTAGSLAAWLNTFHRVRQYSGGNYTTAPNVVQQRISLAIPTEHNPENIKQWLTAAGVDAILVSGPNSPEFWKPWQPPTPINETHFQKLWQQQDTTLYAIPHHNHRQLHALPANAVFDQARYLQTLEDPQAPELTRTGNTITGQPRPGDVILLHQNYHPGWQATQNGQPLKLGPDSLGQTIITPITQGPIELSYTGGRENRLCRWISVLMLGALLARQLKRPR